MERFKELSIDGIVYKGTKEIERQLTKTKYNWLLECELENVIIEIQNDILIWKSGIMYWGCWQWGIWKSGDFRSGNWQGGIFYDGDFKADWERGVWKGGIFKGTDLSKKLNLDLVN